MLYVMVQRELESLVANHDRRVRTGVRLVKARKHLDQRRLSAAVLAKQRDDLACGNLESDVVQYDSAGEALREVLDANRRLGPCGYIIEHCRGGNCHLRCRPFRKRAPPGGVGFPGSTGEWVRQGLL